MPAALLRVAGPGFGRGHLSEIVPVPMAQATGVGALSFKRVRPFLAFGGQASDKMGKVAAGGPPARDIVMLRRRLRWGLFVSETTMFAAMPGAAGHMETG